MTRERPRRFSGFALTPVDTPWLAPQLLRAAAPFAVAGLHAGLARPCLQPTDSMCGFAGIFTSRPSVAERLEGSIGRMIDSIRHRGPDDDGIWADRESGVCLGFRRLAIVDLSAHGHQPMASPSGRFTLVFNGEVYNHADLRHELEGHGFRFRGHSDTEVILAAFEQWGIEASVRRFAGMFAIAVWDRQRRELTFLRDRLGKKPLFLFWQPGHLMFGSELKALLAGPDFDRELDPAAVTAYLRYLYVPAPSSIFRHVRKLMPGHMLTVPTVNAPLPESRPYWSVDEAAAAGRANPFAGSDEDGLDELERLLERSVRHRLEADVPVGALLSGGIDSSLVVALAQAARSDALKTYSIGFDVAEYNEAPAAARVARHIGTDHTELMLTGQDALDVVPRLPELFDEPLADASQIPTFLVCQLARREVTVALSGDGGDEVLAGYHRYIQGERVIPRLQRVPRPLRYAVAAGIRTVPSSGWDRAYSAVAPVLPGTLRHRLPGEKVAKLGSMMGRGSDAEMYRSLLSASQRPEGFVVAANGGSHSAVEAALDRHAALPLLDRMMAVDQGTYLADDLLAKVDRASMAVSLEVRVPLLDHAVVEFAWRLPRRFKIRDGQGKWALRQILHRHVPPALVERPKMGFTVPTAAWLRGPLHDWAGDLLFGDAADTLLDRRQVRRRWRALQRGQLEQANGLWAILMFEAWRDRWLRA